VKPIYQVKVTYIRMTALTCGLKAGQPGIGRGTKLAYATLWGGLESASWRKYPTPRREDKKKYKITKRKPVV
jgi:hypothetical protein